VAGIANITGQTASGMQLAGILNRAHILKGVHIALFNVADTLTGCAINLMSFSRNGYHQLGLSTDESLTTSLSYKSGNAKLYTRIIGSVNFRDSVYYTFGAAFGHDFALGKGSTLSTELATLAVASPRWNKMHQLNRFNVLLNIPLSGKTGIFVGPSFNLYDLGHNNTPDEQTTVIKNKIALNGIGQNYKSWIGWTAGINLF
jgi:hypothetical protein